MKMIISWKILIITLSAFISLQLKTVDSEVKIATSPNSYISANIMRYLLKNMNYKNSTKVNIFLVEPKYFSEITQKVINDFLIINDGAFKYNIHLFNSSKIYLIKFPTIIFIPNINVVRLLQGHFGIVNGNTVFVYFEFNVKLFDQLFIYVESLKSLNIFTNSFFMYAYLIADNHDKTIVYTVEWFTRLICNYPQLVLINSYNKIVKKWRHKNFGNGKFLQYHGCDLVMMLPITFSTFDPNIWGEAVINSEKTKVYGKGIIPKVFNIASGKYNFVDKYQPVAPFSNQSFFDVWSFRKIGLIWVNGTYSDPNVYFEIISSLSILETYRYRFTMTFIQISFGILATPAEIYTPYEKLILPFDYETWILLILTFSLSFFIIFVINRFPLHIREVFYGKSITTPSLNIISIFFGISLIKTPIRNFPRSILIIFVLFCLIFRTCYQSKLFEFMTSQPRRQPPKSVEDLYDRNYTIYATEERLFREMLKHEISKWYVRLTLEIQNLFKILPILGLKLSIFHTKIF